MIGWMVPCANILPADFTEDVSTYEILCQLVKQIAEVDAKITNQLQEANAYTDSKIKEVNDMISSMNQTLTSQMESLQESVEAELAKQDSELRDYIDTQVQITNEYINKQIDTVEALLKNNINTLYAYINSQTMRLEALIRELNETQQLYIIGEIAKIYQWLENNAKMIPIMSPIYHKLEPIQKVIDDMYNLVNIGGITCGEYDKLALTCGQYDSKNLTCYQYDTMARKYLVPDIRFIMYFPETGLKRNYKDVIYWLSELHRTDGLTAQEYDALELTANEYDGKDLSAYQYDWSARNLLTGGA